MIGEMKMREDEGESINVDGVPISVLRRKQEAGRGFAFGFRRGHPFRRLIRASVSSALND